MTAPQYALFYPLLAMFLWTFVVMLLNMRVRVRSILGGVLSNRYFELFQGAEPPEAVVKVGNHFRNLMEMPPLYYVVTLLVMVTAKTDTVFIVMAWTYFGFRVAHSLVHITFNYVPLRFACFLLSVLVLLAMWVRLAWVL